MHYWFAGGHMIWMAISWLITIGLFVMLIWLLMDVVSASNSSRTSPEEVLRRRYAAGEIDTGEYERRLDELRKTKSAA
jgi:putative membrane protein